MTVLMNGSELSQQGSCDGSNWNATVNTGAIAQGEVSITVYLSDIAGNASAGSTALVVSKQLQKASFFAAKNCCR